MADWDYSDEEVADLEDGDFEYYDDSDPLWEGVDFDSVPQNDDESYGDYVDTLNGQWTDDWLGLNDLFDTEAEGPTLRVGNEEEPYDPFLDEANRAVSLTEAAQQLGYIPGRSPGLTPLPEPEPVETQPTEPVAQEFPNMPPVESPTLTPEELQAMGIEAQPGRVYTQEELEAMFQRGPLGAVAATTGIQGSITPNQINDVDGPLSAANALAICGPAAAVAFARRTGHWPSLEEATQMAQSNNWWTPQGMKGPENEVNLLNGMGVAAKLEWGQTPPGQRNPVYNDWAKVAADVSRGNPVILDSPGHYWVAEDYDPETKRFNFGNTAQIFKTSDPNNSWYTADEIAARFGEQYRPRAAIFIDNPETPTPSVVAGASNPEQKTLAFRAIPYDGPLSIPNDPYKREIIQGAAQEFGIAPDIFERQIRQEGGFSQDVWDMQRGSPAGARGPGQFMKATGDSVAQQMGIDPAEFWSSPETQIRGAAKHMKDLLDTNGGDYAKALAAYNAGQGAVNKYGGVPPYSETQGYISNILGSQRPNLYELETEVPMGPVKPTTAAPSEQARDRTAQETHGNIVGGPVTQRAAEAKNEDRTRTGAALPADKQLKAGLPEWMQAGPPRIDLGDRNSVNWFSQYLGWKSAPDRYAAPEGPPPASERRRPTALDYGAALQRELDKGSMYTREQADKMIEDRESEVADLRQQYVERKIDAATLRSAEQKLIQDRKKIEGNVADSRILDDYRQAVNRAQEEGVPLLPPPPGGGVTKPYRSNTSTLKHAIDPDREITGMMVDRLDVPNASSPNSWMTAEKQMQRNSDSAHYVIQGDGRIVRLVPEQFVANKLADPENDRDFLTVQMLTDKSMRGGYSQAQIRSLRWLMSEAQRQWGVNNLTTAQDVRAATTGDRSGKNAIGFDYDWFDDFGDYGWSFGSEYDT